VEYPAVSSQRDPASDREVFRGAGGVVLWWAWVAVAVIVLADLAVQGRDHTAVVMAVLVVAITGVAYGCALRPKVVADPAGITVANPLRDHHVPWASVVKVDAVNALRVQCAAAPGQKRGKVVHSWAVQNSARAARRERFRARRAMRRVEGGRDAGGYGAYPAPALEALQRTAAEFAVLQLTERAQRAQQAQGTGEAGRQPQVRWAWGAIAAMAVPVVALVVVALA
jgi:Bacterial PH domain